MGLVVGLRSGRMGLIALLLLTTSGPAISQTVRRTVPDNGVHAAAPVRKSASSPMDRPLELARKAMRSYQNVKDYQCIFVKQERLRGQLQPENVIAMKLRNQPFSVHLKWIKPKDLVGQEACYVHGKHNGNFRARSSGILGAVGFVTLSPGDPRVTSNSRHRITEAGVGNLIKRLGKSWYKEQQQGKQPRVTLGEFEFARRHTTRVEIARPGSKPGEYYAYRYIVYFDKQTHLPIRVEAYDWPRQGGNPKGDLLECFSYINMRFNTGLGNKDFAY